jgi:arylsulfatase A-like enzyme
MPPKPVVEAITPEIRPMFRCLLLVAAILAAAVLQPHAADGDRPNIVLIMTDDAGYGDFGVYGATDIKTPHIDRLARDGVRLTDFYANGATCTPTRAGLISGRYQQRYALEAPLGVRPKEDAERGLAPSDGSLPRLLKARGYYTALIGKWHLGWKAAYSPNAHGFDEFFGFKSGFIDYYQHTAGADAPVHADLFENDAPVEAPGYMTDLITDRAIRVLEQRRAGPVFLDVAYNAPHWPYQRPDQPSTARDRGKHVLPTDADANTRADYVTMVERVDAGVGRILAALDRLGLRQNTLVIFTNDNGGEWLSHGGPLFHRKGSVWEGGIRVPAIVRWPARIPAGRVSRQVGLTMDLTASMLAAAGATVPAGTRLDGVDLVPILAGRAPEVERTLFWRIAGAVRQQQAVRSGRWKLVVDQGRPLLFDLAADIGERTDVIARHRDVATRLQSALRTWQAEVDAEAKSRQP